MLRSENSNPQSISLIPPSLISLGEMGPGEPSGVEAMGRGGSSCWGLPPPPAPTPGVFTAHQEETSHKFHPKIPAPVPGQCPVAAGAPYLHRLGLRFVPRVFVPWILVLCPLLVTRLELGWGEGWDGPQGCCWPASRRNVGL